MNRHFPYAQPIRAYGGDDTGAKSVRIGSGELKRNGGLAPPLGGGYEL